MRRSRRGWNWLAPQIQPFTLGKGGELPSLSPTLPPTIPIGLARSVSVAEKTQQSLHCPPLLPLPLVNLMQLDALTKGPTVL